MEAEKRGRGRPRGTGDDDSAPLMAVARALTDDPNIKATTAMKAVLRTRRGWPSSDDALIRRWQGKWKVGREAYMQRVQDERAAAEAERQRRDDAAIQAYQSGLRQAREVAIGIGRLAQMVPRQAIGEAVFGILNQHREMARSVENSMASLAERGGLPVGFSAFDTLANSKLRELMKEPAIGGALQAYKAVMDDPSLGHTMRKHEEIGRVLAQSGALGRLAKLAGEF